MMRRKCFGLWIVCIALLLVSLFGCQREGEKIKIGYVGTLTGHLADLGIAGRDGALLAVEEINSSGGINGQKLDLLVMDDKNDPETARTVDGQLLRGGVAAIVGHMTSAMSIAAAPEADRVQRVMISPTTSTDELSGKDDYFLRLYPSSRNMANDLAGIARDRKGLARMAIILDIANKSHTESWAKNFKDAFEKKGGAVIFESRYDSSRESGLLSMTKAVLAHNPDGLLILAGAVDAAMICQQLHKTGRQIPVFVSEWSTTNEFLATGGKSVEGVCFIRTFDKDDKSRQYLTFKGKFRTRFGVEPTFASVFSYESVRVVADALAKDKAPEHLKNNIVRMHTIQGLQGEISMDSYGDVQRKLFPMVVADGQFRRME